MAGFFAALMVLGGLLLWAAFSRGQGKAAVLPKIRNFLHAYDSLHRSHDVYDDGVKISWQRFRSGYILRARTVFFEVDGEEGSRAVDVLPGYFCGECWNVENCTHWRQISGTYCRREYPASFGW